MKPHREGVGGLLQTEGGQRVRQADLLFRGERQRRQQGAEILVILTQKRFSIAVIEFFIR